MSYLSALSFTAAILYFYIGFSAFQSNTKSKLFRIFFLLTVSMTIWSFAGGFIYLAKNVVEYAIWNKIGAFGWCTFESLVLYFVMIFTGNKQQKRWYIQLLILLPAPIFLYMVLFMFGPGIDTKPLIETIFYTGNFLYNFLYLAISISLVFLWGYRSKSPIQKKQASIIGISSAIPFALNLLVQTILPALTRIELPNMGQIFTVIMFLGVNYAITRYQFLSIPTAQITYELFNELTGLNFLLDSQGYIMKANRQVYTLLEYEEGQVIGKHITQIISHEDLNGILSDCEEIPDRMRFHDINISIKSGTSIAFNVSIIPLREKSNLLRGILVVGEDIRATKRLQDEIEQHMRTNEKLKNSEVTLKRNNEYIKELNKELMIMNNNLITKSIKDGLTNLYNHQYINEILEKKLQEISENQENLCIMMMDIDHFKRVNDTFGHVIGDKVLAYVAELIVNNTGDEDYIGRYGGEEFIAILPDTSLEEAVMIAERVRYSVEECNFEKEDLKVTISIGVTQYSGETPNILVNKADFLLYQAKHNGRNRVEHQLEEGIEY